MVGVALLLSVYRGFMVYRIFCVCVCLLVCFTCIVCAFRTKLNLVHAVVSRLSANYYANMTFTYIARLKPGWVVQIVSVTMARWVSSAFQDCFMCDDELNQL